jgi:hypothetical protein
MDLKEQIRRAFADVPYPGDGRLTSHRPCPECEGVARALEGKAWTSLSASDVGEVQVALTFLIPEAFQYYLPAFMIGCIDDRDAVRAVWDSIVLHLRPHAGAAFETKVRGFSAEQAAAIGAFLEWEDGIDRQDWGTERSDEKRRAKAIAYWKARGAASGS